jgi:hypothetical protein
MLSRVLLEEDFQRTQLGAIKAMGITYFLPPQWIAGWASQRGRN